MGTWAESFETNRGDVSQREIGPERKQTWRGYDVQDQVSEEEWVMREERIKKGNAECRMSNDECRMPDTLIIQYWKSTLR
jgi:hypothetical protein